MLASLLLGSLLAIAAQAQSITLGSLTISSNSAPSIAVPTGNYISYTSQSTVSSTSSLASTNGTYSRNGTNTASSSPSSTTGATLVLAGSSRSSSSSLNGPTSQTSTVAAPVNTQPCNNYPEFCSRKYSNITEVCAHNSAFAKPNNAESNQEYGIIVQLNDGIRMIQGETHYVNNTIYSCHSSCDLLNVGTFESELATVASWVEEHPYDVVTILIVNSNYVNVNNYTAPLMNSGLGPYLYYPPKVPMRVSDWPTLGEMILTGKRVVVFMDYEANQSEVPYILDQFSQMWETPFSPVDSNFPCTIQRPPSLDTNASEDYLYLANHNLNVEITLGSLSILIPNSADLNQVNAVSGNASLGLMANSCRSDWGRPPNFLLVDYYNFGNGSVFEVAAQMNNVTYNRKCCGLDQVLSSDSSLGRPAYLLTVLLSISASFVLFF